MAEIAGKIWKKSLSLASIQGSAEKWDGLEESDSRIRTQHREGVEAM